MSAHRALPRGGRTEEISSRRGRWSGALGDELEFIQGKALAVSLSDGVDVRALLSPLRWIKYAKKHLNYIAELES